MKQLIVIAGPTASGKTQLSLDLAKHFSAEIFNADSRQFYTSLDIGTAKPNKQERKLIPHHFIDIKQPNDYYSAGAFEKDCVASLNAYFQNKETALLVGGSGLYIKAIIEGFDDLPRSEAVRESLISRHKEGGLDVLIGQLKKLDPEYAEVVDQHNAQRIIRALEVIEITSRPYSSQRRADLTPRSFVSRTYCLNPDRSELYNRINLRVDEMMENGLLQEVESLRQYQGQNALKTVGYNELFQYLDGSLSLTEAVEKIKQHTRNYAKRQMTWFRNQGEYTMVTPPYFDQIIKHLQ